MAANPIDAFTVPVARLEMFAGPRNGDSEDHSRSDDSKTGTATGEAEIREALARRDVKTTSEKRKTYGKVLRLNWCLTSDDHTSGASIIVHDNGAVSYKCQHASCADKGINDAVLELTFNRRHEAERVVRQFEILDIEQFRKRPEPVYIVKGVIQEKALTMFYGGYATFKTFIALDIAMSIAAGLPCQGFPTVQGPTLYVIGEGGGFFMRRVEAWLKHHGINHLSNFYMLPGSPKINDPVDLKALIPAVKALPVMPVLIVLDTMARTYAGSENDTKDMGLYVDAAGQLQALGCSVLVVHHTGKDGKYRGNSSFPGATETIIRADRKGNGVRLRNEKQKDGEEFRAFSLKKNVVALGDITPDGSDLIDLDVPTSLIFTRDDSAKSDGDDLTGAQVQVLTALLESGETGLTFAEWLTAYGGQKTTLNNARRVLSERGYVESATPTIQGRGNRYRVTVSGRATLESAEEGDSDDDE